MSRLGARMPATVPCLALPDVTSPFLDFWVTEFSSLSFCNFIRVILGYTYRPQPFFPQQSEPLWC